MRWKEPVRLWDLLTPKKADPGTIRKDFGMDIQRNSVHGSDSKENAAIEINLYFKPEEIVRKQYIWDPSLTLFYIALAGKLEV